MIPDAFSSRGVPWALDGPLEPSENGERPVTLGVCALCGSEILFYPGYTAQWYALDGIQLHDGECLRQYLRRCVRQCEEVPGCPTGS